MTAAATGGLHYPDRRAESGDTVIELEKQVMRKVSRRLVPLLMTLYFVAYVDRINLGFAGLTMNKDLGLSPQVFGLGAAFFSSAI